MLMQMMTGISVVVEVLKKKILMLIFNDHRKS